MIEKIVSILGGGYWYAVALIVGAASSWYLTADHYEKVLQNKELEAAIARAEQGKKDYVRIIEAQNGLDSWRATAGSFADELGRLREQSRSRSVRESTSACRVEREAVAKCESLLAESVELLAEGAELSERNAAVHDALASAVK